MGLPGSQFPGEDAVMRELRDVRRQLQQVMAANQLGAAGIRAVEGGIFVEGSETVSGPLTVNGVSEFNGSMSISGPLNLQPGSIQNDSLANPVQMETSSNGVNNYAIGTTSTVRASLTLTVPSGFTQAVIIANPTAMGFNNTAGADYLYVQAVVQGVNSGEMYSAAPAGLGVGLASPFHTTLYGLAGGSTITVSVATRTSTAAWAANGANQANIYATALYLR